MEDTRHTLSVALILSYKRSTHEKKKKESSPKENLKKKTIRKQKLREKLKAVTEDSRRKQRINHKDQTKLSSSSYFLVFCLFMGVYLMDETILFIVLS